MNRRDFKQPSGVCSILCPYYSWGRMACHCERALGEPDGGVFVVRPGDRCHYIVAVQLSLLEADGSAQPVVGRRIA